MDGSESRQLTVAQSASPAQQVSHREIRERRPGQRSILTICLVLASVVDRHRLNVDLDLTLFSIPGFGPFPRFCSCWKIKFFKNFYSLECRSTMFTYLSRQLQRSVVESDTHNFGNLDPDPHNFGNLDPHPHQIKYGSRSAYDPDLHKISRI
jgi:hypothetical protein